MRQASKPNGIIEVRDNGTGQAAHTWPPVLTRPEGAKMCGISIKTFDTWVRKGSYQDQSLVRDAGAEEPWSAV